MEMLVIFLITTLISMALAPKPPNAKADGLEDFTAPTSDPKRPIGVLFGTARIKGSHCVYYGDLKSSAIRK